MSLLYLLALAVLLGGCAESSQPAVQPRPVKVITATALGRISKDFAGMATSDDEVNLAFKLSGQVMDITVSEGESVRRGEVLARLDPRDVELRLSADRSAYEEAASQLRRMQRLLEHDAVSRQKVEMAQTRYAQTKAAYDNSRDLLKDTRLTAPFDGVVERKLADNFERVEAGQPVIRFVKPETTNVKFTLPESAKSLVGNPRTRFWVVFDNYRDVRFAARLKDYAKTSSDASGFPVTLTLDDDRLSHYDISPGMSCTITMSVPDDQPDAVSLPVSAICSPVGGGSYVWVVGDDDRVHRHDVRLGELFGRESVVIESGVSPGQRVVTAGVYRLRENEKVTLLNQQP